MHEKHLTKLRVKPKTSPNYCPVRTSLLSSLRGPWSFLSKTVDGSTVCRLAGPCRSLQVAAVDCKSLHGSTAPPCNLSLQTSLSSRLSLSLESVVSPLTSVRRRTRGVSHCRGDLGEIAGLRVRFGQFDFRNYIRNVFKICNLPRLVVMLSAGRNKALYIVSRFVQSLSRQVETAGE